jgi:hypothetical protein
VPHHRVTGGDTGEIPKTAGSVAENVEGIALPGQGPMLAASVATRLGAAHGAPEVGLVTTSAVPAPLPAGVAHLAQSHDAAALAADLFALFRRAETLGYGALVVEAVPEAGIGRAVMDRLRRAATATGGTIDPRSGPSST